MAESPTSPQSEDDPEKLTTAAADVADVERLAAKPEVRELLASVALETYSGPFPPPAVLERYEQLAPGTAKRIFDMAEAQATHRQHLEKVAVEGEGQRALLGLIAGTVVALAVLGVAAALILVGHDVSGATLGVVDLAGLVSVFVYGTRSRRRERVEKAQIMSEGYTHSRGQGRVTSARRPPTE